MKLLQYPFCFSNANWYHHGGGDIFLHTDNINGLYNYKYYFRTLFMVDVKNHILFLMELFTVPLWPLLANAFLCHHESKWLASCPVDFKPIIYLRYVDDIFIWNRSKEEHAKFCEYTNTCHINMTFTSEVENEG